MEVNIVYEVGSYGALYPRVEITLGGTVVKFWDHMMCSEAFARLLAAAKVEMDAQYAEHYGDANGDPSEAHLS